LSWGRSLHRRLIASGLANVTAEAHFEFRRGGSPGAQLDKANLSQVRDQLLGERLLASEELDGLLRRLDDPDFVVAAPVMFSALGQQQRT
jgi:hypothetical protein